MVERPKVLAFAGSLRKDSFNKKLIKIAVKGAQDAGAEVTLIDLKDYPLPVYDADFEEAQGIPADAIKLKELMVAHDGFLLSLPEYNSGMSGAFKNVVDWISRPASKDEVYLCAFIGKIVTLMSASPGPLGGLRGLLVARMMFENINSIVLPGQKCIRQADQAFGPDGNLKDAKHQNDVLNLAKGHVDFLKRLSKK